MPPASRSAAGGAPGQGPPVFRNPALTVDAVILHRAADRLSVLLVRRGREPFRGRCALPGGFVEYGEDLADAVAREVAEETGLTGLTLRQFRTYGQPGRDPRGHTVSVVYVAQIDGPRPEVRGGDDAEHAGWYDAGAVPALAFDHGEILGEALAALPRP